VIPGSTVIGCGLAFLALSFGATALIKESWQIWLVYGVMCGTAYGLVNINVFTVAIMRAVGAARQGLAVGVSTAGSTVTQYIHMFIHTYIQRAYGSVQWPESLAPLPLYSPLKPTLIDTLIASSSLTPKSLHHHTTTTIPNTTPCIRQVGQLSLVPIFAVVAELYGWRLGFVCVSVATALLVVPSYLLLREDEQRQAQREALRVEAHEARVRKEGEDEGEGKGEYEVEHTSVWARLSILHRTPAYWVILAVFVICGITTTGFIETHFVALVVDRGESVRTGASAFSVLSAANGLAMVGAGYLTDVMDRYVLLGAIFSLRMVAYGLLLTFQSSPMLYVFAMLFGLADYSVVPPVCSLVKTLAVQHGVDFTGLGVGVLLCWHSIGAAVGAWVGGHTYVADGSYQAALFICCSLCLVAALALFAMPVLVGGGRRLMDERGDEVTALLPSPQASSLDKPEALELTPMPVKV